MYTLFPAQITVIVNECSLVVLDVLLSSDDFLATSGACVKPALPL